MLRTIIAAAVAGVALMGGPITVQQIPATAPPASQLVTAPVDFLTMDAEAVPDDVWGALVVDDQGMSDPNDGADRLYFPVGSEIDIPGGWLRATYDGWLMCEDYVTTGAECTGGEYGEPAAWVVGS